MKRLLLYILIASLPFMLSCEKNENSGKLNVVSTIGMINDIVRNIGGEFIDAQGLMGPGVDPHLYKASAGDVKTLISADIIFMNGLHLEAKMGEVLEKMRDKTVVPVAEGIDEKDLLTPAEFKGAHDPHVWFDVRLWMTAVTAVRDTLIEKDPTHKDSYTKNAALYLDSLNELDAYIRIEINKIPANLRVLVTAHDAFNYFGKSYGFAVLGLQGISTESEAGTKDVQRLAAYIAEAKIPAIFIESSIPKRNIKAVQDAVMSKGWNVVIGGELFSDAMGNEGTLEGTYIGMVKHNVDTIVRSLTATQ
jgi:manganese/zinc/iron transport system substrate-binding protein